MKQQVRKFINLCNRLAFSKYRRLRVNTQFTIVIWIIMIGFIGISLFWTYAVTKREIWKLVNIQVTQQSNELAGLFAMPEQENLKNLHKEILDNLDPSFNIYDKQKNTARGLDTESSLGLSEIELSSEESTSSGEKNNDPSHPVMGLSEDVSTAISKTENFLSVVRVLENIQEDVLHTSSVGKKSLVSSDFDVETQVRMFREGHAGNEGLSQIFSAYLYAPIPSVPISERAIILLRVGQNLMQSEEEGMGSFDVDPVRVPSMRDIGYIKSNLDPFQILVFQGESSVIDPELKTDALGSNFLSVYVPILDTTQSPVAVLGIRYNVRGAIFYVRRLQYRSMGLFFLFLLTSLIIVPKLARAWDRPSQTFERGLKRIIQGDCRKDIKFYPHGQYPVLTSCIKDLSEQMKNHEDKFKQMDQAYERFFSKVWVQQLGQSQVTDLRLGDYAEKSMTIMFADIRSYYRIAAELSPSENFKFMSDFMRKLSPIIRQNKGFIDKFLGDAIMALFPDGASTVISCAVGMQKATYEWNREMQNRIGNVARIFGTTVAAEKFMHVGVGLHYGKLALGIVGDEHHLEGTVISSAVNLASRLESLTKYYGVNILISESTWEQCFHGDMSMASLQTRYLGRVIVKGSTKPVKIYEVFTGDRLGYREFKLKTKITFEKGVDAFENKNFLESIEIFSDLEDELCQIEAANPEMVYLSNASAYENRQKKESPTDPIRIYLNQAQARAMTKGYIGSVEKKQKSMLEKVDHFESMG